MGSMKMAKRNSDVARRAWSVLRLALPWARKGGVFKRRLMTELRMLPKLLRSLGGPEHDTPRDRYGYGERQLSFDKSPVFSSSSGAALWFLSCLNAPTVDFDYDFEYHGKNGTVCSGESILSIKEEEEEYQNAAFYEELESIDSRAEEFIAKFYEQMKKQTQISYLHYNH